jgi:DNA-binding LacI/PurR family transcriptional regulator
MNKRVLPIICGRISKDELPPSVDFGMERNRIYPAMEHLPKRTSLVHETAATLKEWISSGVLQEELPGELQLKARLGVGRDTLRLALTLLTREGWVSPARKGRQRRVQTGHPPLRNGAASSQLPVTFLSPFPVAHRVTLLELEDLQTGLAEQGRSLRFLSPDIFDIKHPERQLDRMVREHPSAAWILYVVGERIQRWFDQQGIPTFLFGSPFPNVKLPFVVTDWEAAAFHAGIQLVREGHRTIGILEFHERFPGLLAEERGLERALATANPKGRLIIFKDDRSPVSVARCLESAFALKERPTALVLTRAAQFLTCFSWLVPRGIRVPGDISIVSLADDSWFEEFHPPVSFYQSDAKVVARHIAQRVLELVATGQVTKKSIRFPIDYVPGATIGPAPIRKT